MVIGLANVIIGTQLLEAVFIYQIDYSCHRRFHRL